MTWANDAHGFVFKASEVKLYFNGGHTWAMKLSQLHRQTGEVRIMTYSLPDLDYVLTQFGRRPWGIRIVCHDKFFDRAEVIKAALPDVRIAVTPRMHSKVLLIEPKTVYVTSANFGHSGWHETTIGVRSQAAHDAYVEQSFNPAWLKARELR